MLNKILSFIVLMVSLLAFGVGTLSAAIIVADSPNDEHIQAAINSASDGDTVSVPAGTGTWDGAITVSNGKGIKIIGDGSENTTVNVYQTSGGILTFNTLDEDEPCRLSGIRFNLVSATGAFIFINGTATDWRIDNNYFNGNNESVRVISIGGNILQNGVTYGVIDHNYFTSNVTMTWVFIQWTHPGDNPNAGSWIWSQPAERGTAQAVYIEDNTFNVNGDDSQIIDCRWGAKYVLRYNDIHNPWISTHSGCINDGREPIWQEIYRNKFTDDIYRYGGSQIEMRSTSAVIWDNDFTTASANRYNIRIDHERTYKSCGDGTYYDAQCDGSEPYDENILGTNGWRCLGQPGWGPPQGSDMSTYSFAGVFAWDNHDYGGVLKNLGINSAIPDIYSHMQVGRELFNAADMSFGPLSSRPPTCSYSASTGRDVYVSTDDFNNPVIFQCSATDTWTKHWEPYAYPHPLVSGEIPADETAPSVTITTDDPSAISADSLAVAGTALDAVGVSSCKYRIGAAPSTSNGTALTGTTSWSGTATGFSEGANTLYCGCTDAAGNWGSDSITVNYTIVPETTGAIIHVDGGADIIRFDGGANIIQVE